MQSNLEIYFSNRLDVLYEMLKRELFFLSTPPMMRRLIVVYGPAMKTWLMLKMAQDPELDVAAGFEVIYLSQAFEHLLKLSSCASGGHLPSHLELSLAIEKECMDALQNFRNLERGEQSDWQPLIEYLKLGTESLEPKLLLSRKAEKRLISLSEQLARLFQDYGRFALKMAASWELPDCPGWQPRLWRRLFKEGMKWTYPARELLKNGSPRDFTLHFFSISFITGSEFEYLARLSLNIPVRYYLLSPCAVFWSDIRSDRESAYLQHYWQKKLKTNSPQIQTLEEQLLDRNPLLANFGRMGREMACQIEESQADVKAAYMLPECVKELDGDLFQQDDLILEESSAPLSLLHAVQADLLMMRNPEGAPLVPVDDAQSIQLHIAPSRRREVEILYHNLLKLIQEDSGLTPGNIIVMAPKLGTCPFYPKHIWKR